MPTIQFSHDSTAINTKLLGNDAVVTHDEKHFSPQCFFRPFPGPLSRQIGLSHTLAIDKHDAAVNGNPLTRQTNDAFDYDLPVVIRAKTDQIPATGLMSEVRPCIDNPDLPIMASRFHAPAHQPHGHQNKPKQNNTGEDQNQNSHQSPLGATAKKHVPTQWFGRL